MWPSSLGSPEKGCQVGAAPLPLPVYLQSQPLSIYLIVTCHPMQAGTLCLLTALDSGRHPPDPGFTSKWRKAWLPFLQHLGSHHYHDAPHLACLLMSVTAAPTF